MELVTEDIHRLRAAVGWLELGNANEALAELDQLSSGAQEHPEVLEARWLALAHNQRWEAATKVARALIAIAPARPGAWLHHAYALRRSPNGGLLAAFNALVPVVDQFPEESTIPYNLACYTCQMERDPEETMRWLRRAMAVGKAKAVLRMALNDPDLAPLHAEIKLLAKESRTPTSDQR